jgi:hypothetical protein
MQMVINDIVTIQLPAPSAFVLANGNSSKSTKDSEAHLQEESKVTMPRKIKPRSMLFGPLTRSIKLIHLSQFLRALQLLKSGIKSLYRDPSPTLISAS